MSKHGMKKSITLKWWYWCYSLNLYCSMYSGVQCCHSPGKETIFLPRTPSSNIPASPPRWQKVKQVMAWMKWVFYDVMSSRQAARHNQSEVYIESRFCNWVPMVSCAVLTILWSIFSCQSYYSEWIEV